MIKSTLIFRLTQQKSHIFNSFCLLLLHKQHKHSRHLIHGKCRTPPNSSESSSSVSEEGARGQPPEAAEPYLDSKHRRGGRGSSCTRGGARRALTVDEEGARLSRRRSLQSADLKKKEKKKKKTSEKKKKSLRWVVLWQKHGGVSSCSRQLKAVMEAEAATQVCSVPVYVASTWRTWSCCSAPILIDPDRSVSVSSG